MRVFHNYNFRVGELKCVEQPDSMEYVGGIGVIYFKYYFNRLKFLINIYLPDIIKRE